MRSPRFVLCAMIAACSGGSPAAPSEPGPPGDPPPSAAPVTIRLLPADTTLAAFDVEVDLRVEALDAEGRVVEVPAGLVLEKVGESPALEALPVIGGLDSSRRRVYVRGPGTARVLARAGELASGEVTVRVAPSTPIIESVADGSGVTAGARVTVRGYRLDLVAEDAISIEGEPVDVVEQTASTLVFLAPQRGVEGCAGRARVEIAATLKTLLGDGTVSIETWRCQGPEERRSRGRWPRRTPWWRRSTVDSASTGKAGRGRSPSGWGCSSLGTRRSTRAISWKLETAVW